MNRRGLLYFLGAWLLAGCDSEPKPDPVAAIVNRGKIEEAISAMDEAIGQLEADVSDFDTMNWREVAPSVKADSESVQDAFSVLRAALGYKS